MTYIHADVSEESWAQREESRELIASIADATMGVSFRDAGQRVNIAEYDLAGADVYLCGGVTFLQALRADIEALPVDKSPKGVYFELFSPNDWLVG